MNSVYITRVASYFPNEVVENSEMEDYLGMVNGKPSKARAIVLRNNGIKKRYYAITKEGVHTHTNAQLAAEAIRRLFNDENKLEDVEILAAGTTSPDQLLPSHAALIHGELGGRNMELISTQGACATSMQALKYAFLAIASGEAENAVVVGSEKFSSWMHADRFAPEAENLAQLEGNPYLAFEKDFLRWMLSDGAGAAYLSNQPNKQNLSLKLEWVEISSYADQLDTCMYAGAIRNEDGSFSGWRDLSESEIDESTAFALKQDTRLLGENIVQKGGDFLKKIMVKRNITVEDVDYFMPHMSSEFFKGQIEDYHVQMNFQLPKEKWFYNLTEVGNIGAASPFVMLEEAWDKGLLKKDNKILIMVPESARFSYAYIYLTVV